MNKKTKSKKPANKPNAQSKYKDTLFRMLFKEEKNMLSLYNALNETTYTDTEGLEVTTLENAVYMNYKNDVSFIFNYELMLYEHQSTQNPNMPLRDLIYVTAVIKGLIKGKKLYRPPLIELPAPRFVVFYNGESNQPERQILRLSDAYKKKQANPELELTVTVYNINYGHNPQLLEACQLLNEYAQFVSIVRTYAKTMSIPDAVEKAVTYCIDNSILRDFLIKNRAEATNMCIYEFNEKEYMKSERDDAYKAGHEDGLEQGRNETLVKTVESAMQNFDLSLEEACKGLGIEVEDYQNAKTLQTSAQPAGSI